MCSVYKMYTLCFALVFAACATAPVARQFDRTATFPGADFDAVWNAVIDLFGERGWAIDNMEKNSGLITTDWMTADESYLDCGSAGALGRNYDQMGRFNIVAREQSDGVSLTVNTTWRARRQVLDGNPGATECFSTGVLERVVHEQVTLRIGSDTAA